MPTPSATLSAHPGGAPRARTGTARALGSMVGLVVIALAMTLYLAGTFFLWAMNRSPLDASPLTVVRYAYHHGARAEVRGRLIASSGAALLVVGVAGTAIARPRRRALHGEARFASAREIRSAGLFAERGILLGEHRGRFVTLGGQQGVIVAAPPRSGKGVGIVVPNLLEWPDSVICLDIKRENWTLTAGYRRACGQAVYLFDPFAADGCTARWNPLDYVSENPNLRIDDLQRIAAMLLTDSSSEQFWVRTARSLFVGVALYLFERRDYERALNATLPPEARLPEVPVTIGEVLRQSMVADEEGFAAHWNRVLEGWRQLGRPLSHACTAYLRDLVTQAPQTLSSVRKTFTSQLDLWWNPLLDEATSASDFDLRDLRKRRMSIYLAVKPRDFERLQTVMNLFFQQAIGEQTAELPEHNPALKHQLLVLLDEFTAIGKLPILLSSIAFVPGYNVRTLMVIQTPAQLAEVYGREGAKIMLKTLAARVVFAPNDIEDAKQISEELGATTVNVKSRSFPSFFRNGNRSASVTVSEQRRLLMLPQEVKEMGMDAELVFYERLRPIRCQKIRYYADPRFARRVMPAPAIAPLTLPERGRGRTDDHFALWQHHIAGATLPVRANAQAPRHAQAPTSGHPEPPARGAIDAASAAVIAAPPAAQAFSLDFSAIEIPPGRTLTDTELKHAVDRFFEDLQAG